MPLHCFSPFFPYFLLWELHHTALTTQSAISRTNFRLFVALFGPLAQCHIKCKDLIDTGIFHGEITSQEADDRLRAADAVGGYLVRLRKGSRHQVALAFMDSQKMCKHILLDVNQNMYCIHQLPQAFTVCRSRFFPISHAFFITFLTFFTLLDLINHLKQQQQPKQHRQSQNLCKRTGPSLRTLWCGG